MNEVDATKEIFETLLNWYEKNRRILPWREDPTPYHVWLSEIMLQQTRVEAVKPYYARFLERCPQIQDLAAAQEEDYLKLWEGLGYYSRVRNLHQTAEIVVDQYGGELPSDYRKLLQLPGIGTYTAGAIASIAFGKCEPAVDGNILRVWSRLNRDGRDIGNPGVKKAYEQEFRERYNRYLSGEDKEEAFQGEKRGAAGRLNQAFMDLGAGICSPNGKPRCPECPLQNVCQAHKEGVVDLYPFKSAKKPRVVEAKTLLLIQDQRKTAIRKRGNKGLLAGLYEFPMLEGHLSAEEVLNYLKEEGIAVLRIQELRRAKHIFSHKEWNYVGYRILVDELESLPNQEKTGFLFIEADDVENRYPIPSAFQAYTEYLNWSIGGKTLKKVT